jgi:adenylosuccinate synthase
MSTVVVVGAQWGDEGKGKIVDLLAQPGGLVVRYQGGNNAGHTVVVGDEVFKLHLIPSGILHPTCLCLMGDGTVIDPGFLAGEVAGLQARGISCDNLRVSCNAHLIMPYHRVLDGLMETARGAGQIGTTLRGIGPAYTDKSARLPLPVRFRDLQDEKRLRRIIEDQLAVKNRIFAAVYAAPPMDAEEVFAEVWEAGKLVRDYGADVHLLVQEAVASGKPVVFEGAQATFLDLDYGTFPFVTSSHPVAGAACLGTGIGPTAIDEVMLVCKAYTTRVGAGVFPTERDDEVGALLRERGAEYGTTTGRPRRCGWLDGVVLRTAARFNGATGLSITKLDVLDQFPTLPVCVAYRLDGKLIETMPAWCEDLDRVEPVFEELPGWQTPLGKVRSAADLPPQARAYIAKMGELAGVPVKWVSLGADRDQTLEIA